MSNPSKYSEYKKAARDLSKILDVVLGGSCTFNTLENISGVPNGKRLQIKQTPTGAIITVI